MQTMRFRMWGQAVALMATRGWQVVSERLQLKGFTETGIGALVTRLMQKVLLHA